MGTGAGDVGTGAHRLLFLVVVVVVVVASHVVVAGAHPDGVVHDAVHDRVGVRAAPEPFVPVLLLVLGAEDRAAGVVAAFHELEEEPAELVVRTVEQPFVEHEQRVRRVAFEDLGPSLGLVARDEPFLLEVRHPDVARADPVAARLSGDRVGEPCLARSGVSLEHHVPVSADPRAGGQLVDDVAVQAALLDHLDRAQVGVRVAQPRSTHQPADPVVEEHAVRVVDREPDAFGARDGGEQVVVLGAERVDEPVAAHLAQFAFGLDVEVHRSPSLA